MNLRGPIAAMLWENWRVSRVEAGQRLALGLVAAGIMLANPGNPRGPMVAFWILIALHSMIWFSIAKLNGGRFADGYKPGYPFHLQFTRPVRTSVIVGVAMAYDALSCTALYLLSAGLLGWVFGRPLPMLSVAVCLVVYHLAYACVQWSTRNRIVQWVGSIAFSLPLVILVIHRMPTPPRVELTLGDHLALALAGVVCVWLTVAGVARQRRGDSLAVSSSPQAVSGGYPEWLVSLFRWSCPTSSATRAQVWFELRSSGLPALAIGLMVAMTIGLLYALSVPFAPFRDAAIAVTILSVPIMLWALGSNAFGIRRRQGRMYASAFELTQPLGSAQLAGIKVLVRTCCVLLPLIAIGVSIWASSSLLSAWGAWLPDQKTDALPKFLAFRQTIVAAYTGQSPFAHAMQAVVAGIAVAGLVAWQAAREALKIRYHREVLVAQWAPVVFTLLIALLALAGKAGVLPGSAVRVAVMAAMATATAVLAAAPVYFLWSSGRERVLSTRYLAGLLVVLATFAAAYAALLRIIGEPHDGMHWIAMLLLSWPVLLVLFGGVVAPWALNRVRHI